jgi:hypothetical protein
MVAITVDIWPLDSWTFGRLLRGHLVASVGRRLAAGFAAETLAALGERHLGPHGGLVDGCYNVRKPVAPRNELIWGDYFALEAALGRAGTIATDTL